VVGRFPKGYPFKTLVSINFDDAIFVLKRISESSCESTEQVINLRSAIRKGGSMLKKKGRATPSQGKKDHDALFVGDGMRAIARKTIPPGFTVPDLQQFLALLYGMFEEKEAKQVRVFDPFAQEKARKVTVARLAEAIDQIIESHSQKCA
jgi:hypothetical protein